MDQIPNLLKVLVSSSSSPIKNSVYKRHEKNSSIPESISFVQTLSIISKKICPWTTHFFTAFVPFHPFQKEANLDPTIAAYTTSNKGNT